MDTPYTLRLRPHRELSLDEIVSWYAANITDPRDLLPRIEGHDTIADIYNYLTSNSLGKYLGMLAAGGLGTYIGTQFGDSANVVKAGDTQTQVNVGNLGIYAGQRFNTLDQADQGISITVIDKANGLGAYSGALNQIVLTKVDQTGAGLGGYIGQQVAGTDALVQTTGSNLGAYIGQQVGSLGTQMGGQVQGLGGYIGAQLAVLPPHTESVVRNATEWLGGVVNTARDALAVHVQGNIDRVGGSILNGVIGGAGLLGDAFKDALSWLVDGAFDSFESLFGKRVDTLHKLMRGEYNDGDELFAQLDYGVRGGSIVSMLESVFAGILMIPPLAQGQGLLYAQSRMQDLAKRLGRTIPSETDLRDAFLRGFLTEADHDLFLGYLGYSPNNIAIIKELYFNPAPPSDLVRFFVREVFDPQARSQLQLDADFPSAAVAEFRRVGLDETQAHNYWAAHWQLPSPGQVYDMLHRGLIDDNAVDDYLKAADYSPTWRRNLANISHIVPGRIDLRRMFAAGVINEPRLLRGYKDLGYNDPDAATMTEFAKRQAAGNVTELPRGVVLEGYREGTLNRADATAHFLQLGFTPPEASFMMDLEDLKNAHELQSLNEDVIEADLKAGVVNEGQAMNALSSLGVPARRAGLLVALWRSRHAAKTATLTVGHIQHAVREKLIPDAFAFQRLQGLGYNQGDATMLLALAHPQAPANAPPTLTLSHLFRSLREKLLTPAQLQERLLRRGYAPDDARILIELATPDLAAPEPAELTKAELISLAKKGKLPVDAAQRRLVAKGYIAQDVDLLLENAGFTFTPTGQLVEFPRRDLTVAQLSKSYRTGLLEEKEFRFRLGELDYADPDIDLLVELATPAVPNV